LILLVTPLPVERYGCDATTPQSHIPELHRSGMWVCQALPGRLCPDVANLCALARTTLARDRA
jgi:hypothetical protein